MPDIGKMLIYLGIVLVVVGCVIHFGGKFIPYTMKRLGNGLVLSGKWPC